MTEKPHVSRKAEGILGKSFWEKVHYNKRFREGVKKDFLRLQDAALRSVEMSSATPSIKSGNDRVLAEKMVDVAGKYLKVFKASERRDKYKDQHGKFVLLKKEGVFVFNMFMVRDKKIREGNIIFSRGLPKHTGKKSVYIKKPMDLSGFVKIDSGKFHFKQKGFDFGYYRLWGKKEKYFLNFDGAKLTGKDKKTFGVRFKRV